jgi:hypothetical protein
MANSDKNILITPSVGLSTNPTIKFNGANNTPTTLRVLDDGTVSFEGTAGQLFSISDGLSGSIFSVNDVSGIPSIEVLDTGLVKINQYGGSTVFGGSAAIQSSSVNARVSISPLSATTPGLIIKAVSSQTANLTEWQDSSGSIKSRINSAGTFLVTGGSYIEDTGRVFINSSSASYIPLTIRGTVSQTGNLTEWQNSSGAVIALINTNAEFRGLGVVNFNSYQNSRFLTEDAGALITTNIVGNVALRVQNTNASVNADLQQWQNPSGTALASINLSGDIAVRGIYANKNAGYYTAQVNILPDSANKSGIVIRSASSQTADLQQWQDSSGNVLARIYSNGAASFVGGAVVATGGGSFVAINKSNFGVGATDDVATVNIGTSSATQKGLIIKGAASQTANLQEWQDSAGTVLAKVDPNGILYASSILSNVSNQMYGNANGWIVVPAAANRSAMFFRGAASQSANLTEWQNSSGGTLAKVNSTGNVFSWNNFESLQSDIYVKDTAGTAFRSVRANAWSDSVDTRFFQVGSANDNVAFTTGSGSMANRMQFSSSYTSVANIAFNGFSMPSAVFSVVNGNAAVTSVIIRAASSQTANLQEWQNSSGSVLGSISKDGIYSNQYGVVIAANIILGSGSGATGYPVIAIQNVSSAPASIPTNGGNLYVEGGALKFRGSGGITAQLEAYAATDKPLVIKGYTSQTANLQEWQTSTGSITVRVAPNGDFVANTGYISTLFSGAGISGSTGQANVSPFSASTIGLVVRGATSQSANLQEWQDNAGAVMSKISSSGDIYAVSRSVLARFIQADNGAGAYIDLGFNNANSVSIVGRTSTTAPQLIVKAIASQTANLQEWQNSSGTSKAYLSIDGHFVAQRVYAPDSLYVVATGGPGTVNIETYANYGIGVIIKGKSSQTADLQQWQNSAGTVLSSITNNGFLNTPVILENPTISATAATGTINYDLLTNKSVTYYTSNASANWTLNIRGNSTTTLDSLMAVGQSLTIVFMVTQGTTAYYQSGFQIDGTSVTPKWQGGTAPTFGNASGVDAYSITIMKTASATFSVFESQTRFA